ncbi:MAG TPA: SDR family NAD(P)-dependent oxidoreductase [Nitriliruptoraceae bacterium]|nr:SDR family NAD(P)-dependent oxidoreductase [Nitriliruptoraceae bacterium]
MHLAIITGASTGIGAALVDVARRAGAHVATTSRRDAAGDDHLGLDLADPSQWPRLRQWIAQLVTDRVQRITLVHAAGTIAPIGFMGEVDPAELATSTLVNSAAPQVVGDAVIAGADGRPTTIVMVTSGAATSAYAGLAPYCAGKAAMDHWVRVAGAEQDQRGRGVLVWAVAPGVVASDMQVQLRAADPEDFPNTTRHQALQDDDALDQPGSVAERLWQLAAARAHPNGAVLDLREL